MRKTGIRAKIGSELELSELELVQGGIIDCDPRWRGKVVLKQVEHVLDELRNLPTTIWNTITSWF